MDKKQHMKGGVFMKIFASKFLESVQSGTIEEAEKWTWKPYDESVYEVYASGNNTSSQESTYAAEKDNRSDADRPNEGMFVA
jgi:hypothetical protein